MYRGREGMWAWILHRLSGVGIVTFLLLHIIDISLMGWGAHIFNAMVILYTHPVFRMGEILLAGALIFHATNGLRIIAIDFYDGLNSSNRRLIVAALILAAALFVPTAGYMLYEMLN